MRLTRFFTNEDKTTVVIVSQNSTANVNKWQIYNWAFEEDGVLKSSPTAPGYSGDELMNWLKECKFFELDEGSELAKFVLLFE